MLTLRTLTLLLWCVGLHKIILRRTVFIAMLQITKYLEMLFLQVYAGKYILGPYIKLWGRRVIGISGSLIWSETMMELIFNPRDEFRRRPETAVSQIHSPLLHVGASEIFSDLFRC